MRGSQSVARTCRQCRRLGGGVSSLSANLDSDAPSGLGCLRDRDDSSCPCLWLRVRRRSSVLLFVSGVCCHGCFQKQNKKNEIKKTAANTNTGGGSGFCPPPSVIPIPFPSSPHSLPLPIPIQSITIPFPVPSLFESASQYNPVQFSPFHGTPRYVLRTYPGGGISLGSITSYRRELLTKLSTSYTK